MSPSGAFAHAVSWPSPRVRDQAQADADSLSYR